MAMPKKRPTIFEAIYEPDQGLHKAGVSVIMKVDRILV
jgi:hypothetical protein